MVKSKHKDPSTRALSDALREVFGIGIKAKKFIDVGRIPLLCKSVIEMRKDIGEIKTIQKELRRETYQKNKVWESIKTALLHSTIYLVIAIIFLVLIRTHIIDLNGIIFVR